MTKTNFKVVDSIKIPKHDRLISDHATIEVYGKNYSVNIVEKGLMVNGEDASVTVDIKDLIIFAVEQIKNMDK